MAEWKDFVKRAFDPIHMVNWSNPGLGKVNAQAMDKTYKKVAPAVKGGIRFVKENPELAFSQGAALVADGLYNLAPNVAGGVTGTVNTAKGLVPAVRDAYRNSNSKREFWRNLGRRTMGLLDEGFEKGYDWTAAQQNRIGMDQIRDLYDNYADDQLRGWQGRTYGTPKNKQEEQALEDQREAVAMLRGLGGDMLTLVPSGQLAAAIAPAKYIEKGFKLAKPLQRYARTAGRVGEEIGRAHV